MLQGSELIVILLVALVVFGPERLPGLARKLGAWVGEARRAVKEISSSLESEVKDVKSTATEAVAPLRDASRDVKGGLGAGVGEAVADVRDAVTEAATPLRWRGPEPANGPRAADALDDLAEIERTGGPVTDLPDAPPAAG